MAGVSRTRLISSLPHRFLTTLKLNDQSGGAVAGPTLTSLSLNFDRFPKLQYLHLQNNGLESVPILSGSDLWELDLSNNNIETLDGNAEFYRLRFAETVNLSGNPIKLVEGDALAFDGEWDVVRQPLTVDLSQLSEAPVFHNDAFGSPQDRGFISVVDFRDSQLMDR